MLYALPEQHIFMAVPKQHRSKSRQGQARMHKYIKSPAIVACAKCNKSIAPHQACPFCGTYRGKEVLNISLSADKKERKQKEKKRERETGR
ncbi:MAG: 50S ribosomal protein L32 [bacterium]|nr:50S ribosomal protein L32 [bacterium]